MNRSMPPSIVIPELPYPDVREAVEWLCRVFGFSERLRIGDHRAQLTSGGGSIIVTQRISDSGTSASILMRVDNVNDHYEHVKGSGANIISSPTDYPYGERQYTAADIGGHRWTFSQTIADIDPQTWGGILFEGAD